MTYINPREKVFGHLDRLAGWQAGDAPSPVTVEWDLSNACSLSCHGCHFAHTHTKGPWALKADKPASYSETGTYADVALVTRGLMEMAEAGVTSVVWSGGGEPTLHPSISQVVSHAAALDFQQGLYTLGGHLTVDLADHLKQTLTWVVVSLDTPDAETYAAEKGVSPARFEAACEGVRRLTGGSAVVGVSFLVHRENWRRTSEMLALSRRLGATYATFRPMVLTNPSDPGVLTEDPTWITCALPSLQRLSREPDVEVDPDRFVEYRDWTTHGYATCYGVRLLTQITPDGRVWICPNRRGMAGSELGDLRRESFHDIWARHPGRWTDFKGCRAMCRLHLVNQPLATVYAERQHEAFI